MVPSEISLVEASLNVMQRAFVRSVHALIGAVLPSLRIVSLVYTGLGGIMAMVLLVGVAALPATPVLQQVAEPARQAVASLVQPSSDMVTALVSGPSVRVLVMPVVPTPVPFVATASLDITINPAPEPAEPVVETVEVARPAVTRRYVAPAPVQVEEPSVEDVQIDDEAPSEPAPDEPRADVVKPAEPVTMQIATVEQPKALPTEVAPPTTPEEVKARVDAANQAAIDAAKASAVNAKAEADAANQAAIDARTRAAVTAGPAMADATLALPTPTPVSARVANKAAAETAKEAAAKAKADANAANQAAIDAAKAAAKSPKR